MELLILADDLTGALDTGVQFSRQGVRTIVTSELNPAGADPDLDLNKVTVLVVDTESRHLAGRQAYERVREAVERFSRGRDCYYYKKTDSLLRGNVGSELKALMDAVETDSLMFVPSFPGTGRTTREGVQYLHDTPIHETSFAEDLLNPILTSDVASIARSGGGDVVTVPVDLERIRGRTFQILKHYDPPEKTVYIFDAVTDRDLAEIGGNLKEQRLLRFTAGCAGFAGILPELLGLPRSSPERIDPKAPLLVVCGSLTELSHRQLAYAQRFGFSRIPMEVRDLLMSGLPRKEPGLRIVEDTVSCLKRGGNCIIAVRQIKEGGGGALVSGRGTDRDRASGIIADNLAGIVEEVLCHFPLSALVVIGGDTAMALLKKLRIDFLTPVEELVPGVPLSRAGDLCLITKSGGFGSEDVLVQIRNRLK
ncbi:MAG TPA: four-carbon acid sugar kinase family protein [Spirochaetia bacterium]|nr:four-carbon acid sugar kinase family protein [Spirochaetia bacterium]